MISYTRLSPATYDINILGHHRSVISKHKTQYGGMLSYVISEKETHLASIATVFGTVRPEAVNLDPGVIDCGQGRISAGKMLCRQS